MISHRTIRRFDSLPELQRAAAQTIADVLKEAVHFRGNASIALSGGTTPEPVYALLGAEPLCSHIDWNTIHFFWGDERCVPPDHAESNYRMVHNALLKNIAVPEENVHRIEAERPPDEAAALYEKEIRKFSDPFPIPQMDITLLGMGEDGHTASLFPGTPVLQETQRLVADVFVPKLNAHRISMTYPLINHSRTILILAAGAEKATVAKEVLEGEPGRFPIQMVRPVSGRLVWYMDAGAASLLNNS
jgi:6-phosphogluconolactonase